MRRKAVWGGAVWLVVALTLTTTACGGSDGSPTSPTPPPGGGGGTTTITIGANGAVSPQSVTVTLGTRVTFVNNHSRRHDMASDPHPEHSDCPEINQVGMLQPGQSRQTGNLNTVRTCAFHDHDDASNDALKGRIVIQ